MKVKGNSWTYVPEGFQFSWILWSRMRQPARVSRVPSPRRWGLVALGSSRMRTCRNSPRIHVQRITLPSPPAEQKRGWWSFSDAHHRTLNSVLERWSGPVWYSLPARHSWDACTDKTHSWRLLSRKAPKDHRPSRHHQAVQHRSGTYDRRSTSRTDQSRKGISRFRW